MPLVKHTDNSWRDERGYVAIVMLRKSGLTNDTPPRNLFMFMADHYKPPVSIVWATDTDATLIDPAYLPTMLGNGYARNLTDAEAAGAELDEPEPTSEEPEAAPLGLEGRQTPPDLGGAKPSVDGNPPPQRAPSGKDGVSKDPTSVQRALEALSAQKSVKK